MIKKIYYLSVSIMSVGFLLNINPAYANDNCTTYCQENMCRHSPDLATICYEECSQARACHLAAFDELRKLKEQIQRSKKQYTRNKSDVVTEIAPETPTLTTPIDDMPSIEIPSGIPIPPPPPPSLEIRETPKTLEEQIRETKELMENKTQEQENSVEKPIASTSEISSSNINKMPETLMDQIRAGKQLNKVQESETQKPETLLDQIRIGRQLKNAQEREIAPEPPKPETLLDQIRAGKQLNPPTERLPSKAWENKVSDLSEVHVPE